MQNLDKLIAYYLQRKLSGFEMEDIQKSLDAQVIYAEERSLIMNEVQRLEELHRQQAVRRRYAKYFSMAGAGLMLMGAIFFILSFSLPAGFNFFTSFSLVSVGLLMVVSSYFLWYGHGFSI